MSDVLKLARIQIAVLFTFILNKLIIRPFVLENDYGQALQILVLSYPNFCEAIVGTLSLVYIGLTINHRWIKPDKRLTENNIYIVSTLLAAIFVISQELKIHDLGGQNVYDPYDVAFSVIGLLATFILLLWLKPVVTST